MTFQNHQDYIKAPSSEKILLAHLHCTRREFGFIPDGGAVSARVPFVVSKVWKVVAGVKQALASAASPGAVTSSSYHYDGSKLYLASFTPTDEIIVEYRLYFSNAPIEIDGQPYEPRIEGTPKFLSKMSQGKAGINLIGSGNLKLINADGFFDGVYDRFYFENGLCEVFSTHRDTVAAPQIIFRGNTTARQYSPESVTFRLSDSIYRLDSLVTTERYAPTDVRDADRNNYQRSVYGRVSNLVCQSIDQWAKDGNNALTGTISADTGAGFITGTGTAFLSELSEGDAILSIGSKIGTISAVKSDTLATISKIKVPVKDAAVQVEPDAPYQAKNRVFRAAGHEIKRYQTTVSEKVNSSQFKVSSVDGFQAGDQITVAGERATILRVSFDTIILKDPLTGAYSAGAVVTKPEIWDVRFGKAGRRIDPADITITNSGVAGFTLSADAEYNAIDAQVDRKSYSFRQGSRLVHLGKSSVYSIAVNTPTVLGKYLILLDVDGNSYAFWFGASSTPEPTAQPYLDVSDTSRFKVLISSSGETTTTIAAKLAAEVQKNLEFYWAEVSGSAVVLESLESEALAAPSMGDTGFGLSTIQSGIATTQTIPEGIKSRDWIKPEGAAERYQVLSVTKSSIVLRQPFAEATGVNSLEYTLMEYIGDDTPVYCELFGKTVDGAKDGELIATVPDVVADVLRGVGLGGYINAASFADAASRSTEMPSLAIPATPRGSPKTAKNLINALNKTVFGSVFVNKNLDLGYDVLDASVNPSELVWISDDDITEWKLASENFDIAYDFTGNYRHVDFDPQLGERNHSSLTLKSEFVANYIGNTNSSERDLALYSHREAQTSLEREAFYKSFASPSVRIKGPLGLSQHRLGQKVVLDFARLYQMAGGVRYRVGTITEMTNTGEAVHLTVEDIGGIYARGARVSPDGALAHHAATDADRLSHSYITDDSSLVDSDPRTHLHNLIG